MRFTTVRHVIVPSLLLAAAGCGDVERMDDEDAATAPDADTTPDAADPVDAAPPSAVPVNTSSAGTVTEGQTLPLTGLLVTTDEDNPAGELVYTVRALPVDGVLQLDGLPLSIGSTFTQADVDAGKVTYVHDGAENPTDAFAWTVSDGANTVPPTGNTMFTINVTAVNDAPVIVNNPLTSVAEGATSVIMPAKLQVSDAEGKTLTFTVVTVPTRGSLQKRPSGGAFASLGVGGTFTQQDIVDGNVQFVDSGVDDANLKVNQPTSSSFSWKVTDADGATNPPVGANVTSFTITPVDDAPVITWKTKGCQVVNTAVPANPVVTLTDVDNATSDYSICVVSIGDGTSLVFNSTTTTGTTVTVTPVLKNGAATLGIGSCIAANALGGLTFTSSGNQYGGNVSWKLIKVSAPLQTVATSLMEFVFSKPPCP